MTASQLARLAAIEVAVCADRRKAEIARRPSHLLTDAECVQCIYDLCHSGPRGCADRPRSPAQEAEVLRLRALIREQYGR